MGLEAATEVAGRGGIGDSPGIDGIQVHFIVAAQFEIFQAGRVAQGVEGEVQHVIALMIGQVNLQQVQTPVDGLGQSQLRTSKSIEPMPP